MQEVSRRKVLWLEVAAICGWLFLPYILPLLRRDSEMTPKFYPGAWGSLEQILGSLGGLCMLGLIVWLSGDSLKTFGIRKFRAHPDLLISVGLIALLVGTQYLPFRLQLGAPPGQFREMLGSRGPGETVLWGLASLASAVYGEFFYRGYLIPRLEELTKNVWIGVVVAASLDSLNYLLMGQVYALAVNLGASLALGIAFAMRRSLWPLIAAQVVLRFVFYYLP